jgi:hypothetical protein
VKFKRFLLSRKRDDFRRRWATRPGSGGFRSVSASFYVAGYETRLMALHVETEGRTRRVAGTGEIMNAYRILMWKSRVCVIRT